MHLSRKISHLLRDNIYYCEFIAVILSTREIKRFDSKLKSTYIINTHELFAHIWHIIHQCEYTNRHSLSFVHVTYQSCLIIKYLSYTSLTPIY